MARGASMWRENWVAIGASALAHAGVIGAALGVGWLGPPAETPPIEVEIVFVAPDSAPSTPAVPDAAPAEPLAGPSQSPAAPPIEDAPAMKGAANDARPAVRAARVPREARRTVRQAVRTAAPAAVQAAAEPQSQAAAAISLGTTSPMDPAATGGETLGAATGPGVALSAPPWQAAPPPGPSTPPAYGGNPAPAYPAAARRRGQQGQVVLRAEVQADGRPARVEVVRSSGYALLDEAALASVGDWRFAPAETDGKPSAGAVEVPITFKLVD